MFLQMNLLTQPAMASAAKTDCGHPSGRAPEN
jgi:hypothetical protein